MEEYDYYNTYLERLKETYGDLTTQKNEGSGRSHLEALLNAVVQTIDKPPKIIQESTSNDGSTPDFEIEKASAIIGYLENKRPDSDLDKVIKSEQIKRYQKLSNNIMLTNYHEWIWLKDDNPPQRVQLFNLDDLKKPRFRLDHDKIKELHPILLSFLAAKPEPIADANKLAKALAIQTRYLNEFMKNSLEHQTTGKLRSLYEAFKQQLYPQLKITEFADAYAQMLTYGLFLARLNSKKAEKIDIDLQNAEQSIPRTFGVMRELVGFLRELDEPQYENIKWVVEEILFIINTMDREAIATSLSFKGLSSKQSRNKLSVERYEPEKRDPFIYFYEDFLAAYDSELRENRGVYYTPAPVVNFIIHSLDDILKDVFKIHTGFADNQKVTALDFACGTGTFMLKIFQQVLDSIGAKDANWGKATPLIREHLLKNIYGFEYLIAAYAIAHLKISQYLHDMDYQFQADERLKIILANTLEPSQKQQATDKNQTQYLMESFFGALIAESELGEEVKDKRILVITGNPPYSGNSQNPSKKIIEVKGKKGTKKKKVLNWIGSLIEDYKSVDGVKLRGRTLKWLQDDYVKFIRFAQYKMEKVDEGVIGIITNHGFIDNPTFRGMRKSLMDTFDQIYILDLHGNNTKNEEPPDGIRDDNVFHNIQQGVAISFFIKKRGLEKKVFHHEWWGNRYEKFKLADNTEFKSIEWEKLSPSTPNYLFIPEDDSLKPEYEKGKSVEDIFHINSVGITTARDHLAIQFTPEKMKETVENILKISFTEAKKIFKITKKEHEWKAKDALEDLKENGYSDSFVKQIQFRIFDKRFTYHTRKTGGFVFRPRNQIMDNMLKENLALITVKNNLANEFNKVFITSDLTDCHVMDRDISYVFPLYKYSDSANSSTLLKGRKDENFEPEFRSFINKKYNHEFSPEEIMAYIYAILHSKNYRSRYNEFLSRSFPHVPFCENKKDFEELAKIGQEIINLHLMLVNQLNVNLWQGKGNFKIVKVEYNEKTESLYINKDKYLCPVSKEVWEFNMGGYQALRQYLNNRKQKELISDEITHVENIIYSIQNTMKAMETLDSLTKKAFRHWHEQ